MEYRFIRGPVYCRYANTPPIVNSELARRYGIEVRSPIGLQEGKNVKLRFVLADGNIRITCHALIDWIKVDSTGNDYRVGLSELSLSDEEFVVLLKHVADEPFEALEFGDTVRGKAHSAIPVVTSDRAVEITRVKAVTLPLSVIEEIDSRRREVPFSQYVTNAIKDYFKRT